MMKTPEKPLYNLQKIKSKKKLLFDKDNERSMR